jgi:hypothetical protein
MIINQQIKRLDPVKNFKFSKKKRINIGNCRKKHWKFTFEQSSYDCSDKKISKSHHRAVSQFNGKKVRFELEREGKSSSLTHSPIFRALEKKEVWQSLVFSLRMQRENKLTNFIPGKKQFTGCFR